MQKDSHAYIYYRHGYQNDSRSGCTKYCIQKTSQIDIWSQTEVLNYIVDTCKNIFEGDSIRLAYTYMAYEMISIDTVMIIPVPNTPKCGF